MQVFFVISGFVIPWAMFRGHYRLGMMGRFVARRMARIEPPYFAAIGLVPANQMLGNRSRLHQGAPYVISWPQVPAHVGYMNAFIGQPWLLDSFWTLAIEFQYYVAMGLLFPAIARPGFATGLWITGERGGELGDAVEWAAAAPSAAVCDGNHGVSAAAGGRHDVADGGAAGGWPRRPWRNRWW